MAIKQFVSLMPVLVSAVLSCGVAKAADQRGSLRTASVRQEAPLARWEFRTAPLAWLARWQTLEISYRISKKWATGPTAVNYAADEIGNMFTPSFKGYAVGWNANYYFKSAMENGWYLGARAYHEKYRSYPHAALTYQEVEGSKANAMGGYQWRWSSVNLMTGFGMEYRNHTVNTLLNSKTIRPDIVPMSHEVNKGFPYLEVKLGIQI